MFKDPCNTLPYKTSVKKTLDPTCLAQHGMKILQQ